MRFGESLRKIRTIAQPTTPSPTARLPLHVSGQLRAHRSAFAQEILCDYNASIEGVLIPRNWIEAAVGAHLKLGVTPSGARRAGLDIADEGSDRCAYAARYGILLYGLESWSGKDSDIYASVQRAFLLADRYKTHHVDSDADGLGAGVRGDARAINERRPSQNLPVILFEEFRGSASVYDPDEEQVPGRTNRDFFANLKAQSWWHLRKLFENTFRAVVNGLPFDPDQIISIDPNLPELQPLLAQPSQPTYSINAAGKILINKRPDGASSPDRADAVMIAFNPALRTMEFWEAIGRNP